MSRAGEMRTLRDAFCNGRLIGLWLQKPLTNCPYDPGEPTFRSAWMDGFAMGRIEAERRRS